ncbi:MAG: hypothetical protein HKN43_06065 [Rhodothermales bacterium]|nr:hypothetical protein [Rhodothermales bacterium]
MANSSLLRHVPTTVFLSICILSSGCSGCSDSVPGVDDAQSYAQQLQEDINDPEVEALETEELEDLMPGSVAGMTQTDYQSNKTGAFGFKMSTTTAEYEEGNKSIVISITDAGSMKAAVRAANQWMDKDFEETTSSGYSRTGDFFGYRGMEKFNSGPYGTSAELSIFVADRFVVNGKGRNVTMDDVKGAVKDVKLRKLDRKG